MIRANLADAKLGDANLAGALLDSANLTGALLTGAALVYLNYHNAISSYEAAHQITCGRSAAAPTRPRPSASSRPSRRPASTPA